MPDPLSPTDDLASNAVVVTNESGEPVDERRWQELVTRVIAAERVAGEITLTFVDRSDITDLNREHMGVDGPTDVLSFPLDAAGGALPGEPVLLGDIVVCPDVARCQAGEHAGTYDDELALLIVHGILHILGHDHAEPDETAVMRQQELKHLTAFHWGGPAPRNFRQEHK